MDAGCPRRAVTDRGAASRRYDAGTAHARRLRVCRLATAGAGGPEARPRPRPQPHAGGWFGFLRAIATPEPSRAVPESVSQRGTRATGSKENRARSRSQQPAKPRARCWEAQPAGGGVCVCVGPGGLPARPQTPHAVPCPSRRAGRPWRPHSPQRGRFTDPGAGVPLGWELRMME